MGRPKDFPIYGKNAKGSKADMNKVIIVDCAHCGGTGTCTYEKNGYCSKCGTGDYYTRVCTVCEGKGKVKM